MNEAKKEAAEFVRMIRVVGTPRGSTSMLSLRIVTHLVGRPVFTLEDWKRASRTRKLSHVLLSALSSLVVVRQAKPDRDK